MKRGPARTMRTGLSNWSARSLTPVRAACRLVADLHLLGTTLAGSRLRMEHGLHTTDRATAQAPSDLEFDPEGDHRTPWKESRERIESILIVTTL